MKKLLFIILILISQAASATKNEWQHTDFSKTTIKLEDVISGGPAKDGIPAIFDPKFLPESEIDYINLGEPVITLEINGDARAYPIRILIWHQIVNDVVGGVPVIVTYCPLTNTSIVFKSNDSEFGVTGKLYNSNMLMYDKKTESWWQQYTGVAVAGEQTGKHLEAIAANVTSLYIFKTWHKGGKVLVPSDPTARSYGLNPYPGYDSYFPILYKGEYNGKLPKMDYLVAVGNDAWPLDYLRKIKVLEYNDLLITWQPYQNSALDSADIDMGRDVGTVTVQKKTESGMQDMPYTTPFAFAFDAFQRDGVVHSK